MPTFRQSENLREKSQSHNADEAIPPERASLRDRIAHFTWPWFATTMSTGSLAVVLSQTPNRFDGLNTIGKIFFITDLVLFLLFTATIIVRFVLVPKKLFASLHHPVESLFFGAFWVSASLIITCSANYGTSSTGPWLIKALEVVFWLYCGLVVLVAIFQYYVLFQEERLNVADAMPAWIFPIYPLLVVGPMAGTLVKNQPSDAALTMWVGAVMFQGLGWSVAFIMYTMYTQRLMSSTLPAPPTRPGMYVSVGPAGYTSAALVSLGRQAPKVLPSDLFGINSFPVGDAIKVVGILAGLFVFLFACWFFAVSTVAVIAGSRRMTFTLNWWAFVFPNAGLTLAAIQIGQVLNSDGIRGVTSGLTVLLVIMWFVTAFAHIRAVVKGQIMWPGKDEDKDMEGIRWGAKAAHM